MHLNGSLLGGEGTSSLMITDVWRRMITMLDNQYSMLTKTTLNLGIELVKVIICCMLPVVLNVNSIHDSAFEICP